MHIVIDGYNLIRQSSQFSHLDQQDLQAGRDALVDLLAAYKRIKTYKITVVFDGAGAPTGMPRRDRHKGIRLSFSQPGELADAVIKRMAVRERERLLVVSSDKEVSTYCAKKGASVIGAPEFEERLMLACLADMKGAAESGTSDGWQPTTKKRGPSKRLPRRQRKMRQRISKL
ncbi:MAG: hypothetical protein HKP58_15120 [Desulfatitalea sp.]|nr:NYN domain-containing protein [Desulfatitalea sp.]NNK01740.1 hypothetical protein [Desulfatitalea sp.]